MTNCVPSTGFRVVPDGVSTNFDRDEVQEGQVVILNIVAGEWRERCVKSRGDIYNWEVGVIPSLTKPVTTNPHEFEVQGADFLFPSSRRCEDR